MRTAPPVRWRRRQFGPGGGSSVQAEAVRSRRRQFGRGGGPTRRRSRPAREPPKATHPRAGAPDPRAWPGISTRSGHAGSLRGCIRRPSLRRASAASPPPGSQGPWPPWQRTVGERPGAAPARGPPAIDPGQGHRAIDQASATSPSTRPEPPRHRPEPGRHATCSRPPRLPNDRIGRHRCSPPTYRAVVRARVTGPTSGYSTLTFAAPDLSNHEQSW